MMNSVLSSSNKQPLESLNDVSEKGEIDEIEMNDMISQSQQLDDILAFHNYDKNKTKQTRSIPSIEHISRNLPNDVDHMQDWQQKYIEHILKSTVSSASSTDAEEDFALVTDPVFDSQIPFVVPPHSLSFQRLEEIRQRIESNPKKVEVSVVKSTLVNCAVWATSIGLSASAYCYIEQLIPTSLLHYPFLKQLKDNKFETAVQTFLLVKPILSNIANAKLHNLDWKHPLKASTKHLIKSGARLATSSFSGLVLGGLTGPWGCLAYIAGEVLIHGASNMIVEIFIEKCVIGSEEEMQYMQLEKEIQAHEQFLKYEKKFHKHLQKQKTSRKWHDELDQLYGEKDHVGLLQKTWEWTSNNIFEVFISGLALVLFRNPGIENKKGGVLADMMFLTGYDKMTVYNKVSEHVIGAKLVPFVLGCLVSNSLTRWVGDKIWTKIKSGSGYLLPEKWKQKLYQHVGSKLYWNTLISGLLQNIFIQGPSMVIGKYVLNLNRLEKLNSNSVHYLWKAAAMKLEQDPTLDVYDIAFQLLEDGRVPVKDGDVLYNQQGQSLYKVQGGQVYTLQDETFQTPLFKLSVTDKRLENVLVKRHGELVLAYPNDFKLLETLKSSDKQIFQKAIARGVDQDKLNELTDAYSKMNDAIAKAKEQRLSLVQQNKVLIDTYEQKSNMVYNTWSNILKNADDGSIDGLKQLVAADPITFGQTQQDALQSIQKPDQVKKYLIDELESLHKKRQDQIKTSRENTQKISDDLKKVEDETHEKMIQSYQSVEQSLQQFVQEVESKHSNPVNVEQEMLKVQNHIQQINDMKRAFEHQTVNGSSESVSEMFHNALDDVDSMNQLNTSLVTKKWSEIYYFMTSNVQTLDLKTRLCIDTFQGNYDAIQSMVQMQGSQNDLQVISEWVQKLEVGQKLELHEMQHLEEIVKEFDIVVQKGMEQLEKEGQIDKDGLSCLFQTIIYEQAIDPSTGQLIFKDANSGQTVPSSCYGSALGMKFYDAFKSSLTAVSVASASTSYFTGMFSLIPSALRFVVEYAERVNIITMKKAREDLLNKTGLHDMAEIMGALACLKTDSTDESCLFNGYKPYMYFDNKHLATLMGSVDQHGTGNALASLIGAFLPKKPSTSSQPQQQNQPKNQSQPQDQQQQQQPLPVDIEFSEQEKQAINSILGGVVDLSSFLWTVISSSLRVLFSSSGVAIDNFGWVLFGSKGLSTVANNWDNLLKNKQSYVEQNQPKTLSEQQQMEANYFVGTMFSYSIYWLKNLISVILELPGKILGYVIGVIPWIYSFFA